MNQHYRLCAFFALVVGMALLTKGVMRADPPAENCVTLSCVEKVYFIASPKLECWSFETAECAWCWQGRCTDPGPTLPWCVKTEKQIKHYPWDATCQPKCNLNLNSYSESTVPVGTMLAGDFVFKHICSETAPPPPPPP